MAWQRTALVALSLILIFGDVKCQNNQNNPGRWQFDRAENQHQLHQFDGPANQHQAHQFDFADNLHFPDQFGVAEDQHQPHQFDIAENQHYPHQLDVAEKPNNPISSDVAENPNNPISSDVAENPNNPIPSDVAEKPVPTYVSTIEKLILAIMKPIDMTGKGFRKIGKGIKDLLSKIPLGKDSENSTKPTNSSKGLGDLLNPFKNKIKAIYPGTRWCGDGDIASDKEDLGLFKETDKCCRAHDSCTGGIPAGEARDGLLNNGLFTRSPCECDHAFYSCLKEARSIVATKIGTTYFNILRPQCFKKACTIEGCLRYEGHRLIDDKCLDYKYNCTGTEKNQWHDNPDFLGL